MDPRGGYMKLKDKWPDKMSTNDKLAIVTCTVVKVVNEPSWLVNFLSSAEKFYKPSIAKFN